MIAMLRRLDPSVIVLTAMIVLLVLIGSSELPNFLTSKYLLQQLQIASFLGVVATGAFVVILLGHIDLSVPWTMTASAMVATTVAGLGAKLPGAEALSIPLGILAGMTVGAFNGLGVAVLRVPSMIWTLGVNIVLLGGCVLVTGGFAPKGESTELMRALAVGRDLGVPNATLVWLALAAAVACILSGTAIGRAIYAIGNGERAAFLAGVQTGLTLFAAFVFAGGCNAVAGLLLAGYANQAYQAMGDPYLLPAIAAVVVGGTSIQGGKGAVLNVILAVVFVTLLTSVLSVLQMNDAQRQVIYGAVILGTLLIYGRLAPGWAARRAVTPHSKGSR
ncbi:MAG TPA: ABC transporter permease [Dongiaceae bacterium]|jgi:ribose transport system permease protein|nr:ABC transporter permease [Dongiaceae bacterium]